MPYECGTYKKIIRYLLLFKVYVGHIKSENIQNKDAI